MPADELGPVHIGGRWVYPAGYTNPRQPFGEEDPRIAAHNLRARESDHRELYERTRRATAPTIARKASRPARRTCGVRRRPRTRRVASRSAGGGSSGDSSGDPEPGEPARRPKGDNSATVAELAHELDEKSATVADLAAELGVSHLAEASA